jgi:hypothetical protein
MRDAQERVERRIREGGCVRAARKQCVRQVGRHEAEHGDEEVDASEGQLTGRALRPPFMKAPTRSTATEARWTTLCKVYTPNKRNVRLSTKPY